MKVKICGLRERENTREVADLHCEWIGFIFAQNSPRYFYNAQDPCDLKSLKTTAKKTGVFVDEDADTVKATMQKHGLDVIQLHGNETAEYCSLLKAQGFEIIKAFGVDDSFNFDNLNHYVPFIDYFLFDSRGKHAGGNGILFNWKTLFGKRFSKPFLLSGGISPNHIEALKEFNHPDCIGIDLNSRFEISTGLKDVVRIQSFLQKVAA